MKPTNRIARALAAEDAAVRAIEHELTVGKLQYVAEYAAALQDEALREKISRHRWQGLAMVLCGVLPMAFLDVAPLRAVAVSWAAMALVAACIRWHRKQVQDGQAVTARREGGQ